MSDIKYPPATWRPLSENRTQPSMRPTQVILHTAVDQPGPTSLHGFFENHTNLESHLWLPWTGQYEQYISFDRSADANRRANRRPDGTGGISVETEDDGNPIGNPWNVAQVKALVEFIRWATDRFDIPRRLCRNPSDPGIGWHAMWGAPSDWTPVPGKTCPGSTRIAQIRDTIMPAVVAGTEGLSMADVDKIMDRLDRLEAAIPGDVWDHQLKTPSGVKYPAWRYFNVRLSGIARAVDIIGRGVGAIGKRTGNISGDVAKALADGVDIDVEVTTRD